MNASVAATKGQRMGTSITDLLADWRAAERQWERPGSPDELRAAALAVVRAWAAYQDAAVSPASAEFMLVASEDQTYVAATAGVTNVLGYDPGELIGSRIQDIAAPDLRKSTPNHWLHSWQMAARTEGSDSGQGMAGSLRSATWLARARGRGWGRSRRGGQDG